VVSLSRSETVERASDVMIVTMAAGRMGDSDLEFDLDLK
jgi:hypothetical protein